MGHLFRKIKILLALIWAGYAVPAVAQEADARLGGRTRAVVVGISAYQDSAIADLRFADRDAVAFADFLKFTHDSEDQLPEICLLVDSEATLARIQSSLIWLLRESNKGDRAVFYFAGHGDVETIDDREKGFLLAYDTPKNNYRMNALDIAFFNSDILSGLARKNAQAMVILDACHSGALAGEAVGGVEYTARELARRLSNEIKIMSCQSYELSQEAAEFGGGRGVFSYYLVDGLLGRADADNDRQVDLYEIGEYLQKRVRAATAKAQHPEVIGGVKNKALFAVDDSIRQAMKSAVKTELVRDFETGVLQELASKKGFLQYRKFKDQLKKGRLLTADGNCASAGFDLLYADTSMIPLRGIMTDLLVAAFLDSAQQAILAYLNTDPGELELRDRYDNRYERFARYLNRATEILGEKDPRYRETAAKQRYFAGLAMRLEAERENGRAERYRNALQKQQEALQLENRAAYIHNELGVLYYALDSLKRAQEAFQRAKELAPTWEIPWFNLGIVYSETAQEEAAKALYLSAVSSKPDFASAYCYLGLLFGQLEQSDSAEWAFRKAIALSPKNPENFYNFALHLSREENREPESEAMFRRALEIDSTYAEAFFALGNLYVNMERNEAAEQAFLKATQLQPDYVEAHQNLGVLYFGRGKAAAAETQFLLAIGADSLFADAWTSLAFLYRNEWEKVVTLLRHSPLDASQRVLIFCNTGSGLLREAAPEQAEKAFQAAVDIDPEQPLAYCGLLFSAVAQNQTDTATAFLQKTLECARKIKALDNYHALIAGDKRLKNFRKTKAFITVMRTFFPDRY